MYAGIYIERDQLTVAVGAPIDRAPLRAVRVSPTASETIQVEERTPKELLSEAVSWILSKVPERSLTRVGVGSYGPFLSLDLSRRDNEKPGYGVLSDTADPPFKGVNLFDDLLGLFRFHGADPDIIVQTDANVAALGETYLRTDGDPPNPAQVMVYLLINDRIGGGIIKAEQIFTSPLHPEMGQMLGRLWPDDVLARRFKKTPHRGCLSDFAAIPALLARTQRRGLARLTLEELAGDRDHEAWDIEAFYLAQLCLNVTLMLAPTHIVIGSKIVEANPSILGRVRAWLKSMLSGEGTGPMLDYPAIKDGGFVSAPVRPDAGCAGALYWAAQPQVNRL